MGDEERARRSRMALYVDGYVIPVPRKNVQAYRKIERMAYGGFKVLVDA
jgi:uncharacterized protein YbaA (DUF1428 family)